MTGIKDRIHKSNEPLGGYICLIPSAVVTQAFAAAGADWLVVDQEHAPIGIETLHAMVAATAGTNCSPWVGCTRISSRAPRVCDSAASVGPSGATGLP